MRHNPAASFDLGYYFAATDLRPGDIGYVAAASTAHLCAETMDRGAERHDREFAAWLASQVEAAMS
ncbi:MAG TPA: hypothetical protein PKZ27_03150 [Rhodocyclaceae bacterium]|nr:hypothetical protein [Rhodocyclaceae bacterium]